MRDVLGSADFIGKNILSLENGDLLGAVTGLLVETDPIMVSALVIRDEEENKVLFCDYRNVTDVDQQVVVVSKCDTYLPNASQKNILGLPCIDNSGKMMGNIKEWEWQSASGQLAAVTVLGEAGQYKVPAGAIRNVGSGAAVLNIAETDAEKTECTGAAEKESHAQESMEEAVSILLKRVGATLSDVGSRVGERVKQIDKEEINREVNRFSEKVGREVKNVIDSFQEQAKASKYATMESEIISVLRDLEGFSVSSPVYDKAGDVIIIPGQLINSEVVRRTIESSKIAELYRVAVSVRSGDDHE